MKYQVGDKIQLNNRNGIKGEGEIITILKRIEPNKQPDIVVKLNGSNGEFVQQVFEKDIVPPKPTVVFENYIIGGNAPRASIFPDKFTATPWLCYKTHGAEFVRIYKLSDGTWHVEVVDGSKG
jgi:hypothetical protein